MDLGIARSRVQGDPTEAHVKGDGTAVGTGLPLPAAIICLDALPMLSRRGFQKRFPPPFHIPHLRCKPCALHILAAQGFFFTSTAPCAP